jgi:hypothetical protein
MIEKFLIRFCASEVRTMIARLHERPDDFTYGTMWRDLAQARDGLTWVERKVLNKEWAKFKKNQKRRELLNLITKEVLDPTPKDRWGGLSHSNFAQALQNHSTAAVARAQMNAAQLNAAMERQYAMQVQYEQAQAQRSLYQGNRNV